MSTNPYRKKCGAPAPGAKFNGYVRNELTPKAPPAKRLKVKHPPVTVRIFHPSQIHSQSTGMIEFKPLQPNNLRAPVPPPKPVKILDGVKGHKQMPGPAPKRAEIPGRDMPSVVML